MPVITVTLGGIGRGTVVQGWPQEKTQGPSQKQTKAKKVRAWLKWERVQI
jgi:hypothetical protein